MTEPSPERPPVPDLAQIVGAPVVTFLARADEVLLGDTIDSLDGLVRVREIVQRPGRWDLAGDPPGLPARFISAPGPHNPAPQTRLSLWPYDSIRVRRPVTAFGRVKGHTKTVASHNPVKRGCYTHVEGYTAACSCRWKSRHIHPGRHSAGEAWTKHKAGQITDAAYQANSALMFIATAEVVHPHLPPVPWQFTHVVSGENHGAGIAKAYVGALPVDQARVVLAAWRAVPGLTVDREGSWDREEDVVVHTLRGPRRQIVDLRLHLTGPAGEQLFLDADYYSSDVVAPSPGAPW